MEPEGSLSYSQEPATCPYPKPLHPTSQKPTLILSSNGRIKLRDDEINSGNTHRLAIPKRLTYKKKKKCRREQEVRKIRDLQVQ
jgi:hypothetical protein